MDSKLPIGSYVVITHFEEKGRIVQIVGYTKNEDDLLCYSLQVSNTKVQDYWHGFVRPITKLELAMK